LDSQEEELIVVVDCKFSKDISQLVRGEEVRVAFRVRSMSKARIQLKGMRNVAPIPEGGLRIAELDRGVLIGETEVGLSNITIDPGHWETIHVTYEAGETSLGRYRIEPVLILINPQTNAETITEFGTIAFEVVEAPLGVRTVDELELQRRELIKRGFVGRKEFIKEIEEQIEPSRFILLYGNPGVGKTFTLAKIAGKHDGVYIDLKKADNFEGTVAYLNFHIRRRLRYTVAEIIQLARNVKGVEDKRKLLEGALLSVKPGFIIALDNLDLIDRKESNKLVSEVSRGNACFMAASRSRTLPLLEEGGKEAIELEKDITSRMNVARLEVPPFTREEVEEYIKVVAPKRLGDADELFKRSEGNPLYLYYCAHYTITPPPRDLQDYEERILERLQEKAENQFRALRLVNYSDYIPLNEHHISKLLEISLEGAERLLGEVEWVLREKKVTVGSHTCRGVEVFHSHLGEAIDRKTPQNTIVEIHRILANYFKAEMRRRKEIVGETETYLLAAAHHLRYTDTESIEDLQLMLDAAKIEFDWWVPSEAEENCKYVLKVAEKLGEKQKQATARHLTGLVKQKENKWGEALEHHMEAFEILRALGDKRGEAADLTSIGVTLSKMGRWSEALGHHKQALEIHRALGDKRGEAADLTSIGVTLSKMGRWNETLEYCNQALRVDRALGDRHGEARDLTNIGVALYSLGKWSEALEHHMEALEIHRALGDRHGEAADLTSIGVTLSKMGRWNEAIEYCNQALRVDRALGDRHGEANTLTNIGVTLSKMGRWNEAIEHHNKALKIRRALGDKRGEAADLTSIGVALYSLGRWSEALGHHKQALEIHRALGDRHGEARDLGSIGLAFRSLGKWGEALGHHKQALEIHRALGDRHGEASELGNIGIALNSLGRWSEALGHHKQALEIHRALGDRHGEAKDLTNISVALSSLCRWGEALDYFKWALELFRDLGDRDGEIRSLCGIGLASGKLGDAVGGFRYLRDALKIMEESDLANEQFEELSELISRVRMELAK